MLSIEEEVILKLQRLWEIEEIQSATNGLTPEQNDCELFFNNSVSRESSGRIVVKLPFKEPAGTLGLSRNMALKRFSSQERRFARDNTLKTLFMKEYEDCGHTSLVRSPRLDELHYFIPHHCVFKLNSTSTKLRVVFDASCPSSSQKSLNDIIMVGPTIQDELYKILLRFRLRKKRKFVHTNLILSLLECRLPLISPFEVFIISQINVPQINSTRLKNDQIFILRR